MLTEIFLGIITAVAFLLGILLYKYTKEEVDNALEKINLLKVLSKIYTPFAIVFGGLLGYSLKTAYPKEAGIVVFALNLAFGSLLKEEWVRALFASIAFLAAYFITFFLL